MKKMTAVLLVLIMVLSMTAAHAAQYVNTNELLKVLDKCNLTYTVSGIDDQNYEYIEFVMPYSEADRCKVTCVFSQDNSYASLRAWDLITFDPNNSGNLMNTINQLNRTYRYVRWSADTNDNTVDLYLDLIIREGSEVQDIIQEAFLRLYAILGDASPELKPFAI